MVNTHKKLPTYGTALLLVVVILSLVTRAREKNIPPQNLITPDSIQASDELFQFFRESCFDCHSAEYRVPLYGNVFPVSAVIAHHIAEGREELDFSQWDSLSPKKRASNAFSILEAVEDESMPLKGYLILHRGAKPTAKDIQSIREWQEKLEKIYEQQTDTEEED